jgi:hypothetical protein
MRKQLLACAVLAATMIPSLAEAGTITIGICEDCMNPVTEAVQFVGGANFALQGVGGAGISPNFVSNISGTTNPDLPAPALLFSNSANLSPGGTGSHTLDVFVTALGLTASITSVVSGLTENLITDGWTATLSTFISPTNQLFTGTLLDTATFSDIGNQDSTTNINDPAPGPYSVTALYHIVSNGTLGGSTSTIVMVPGPIVGAGLPGLIAACMGLIGLQRRRRRKQLLAAA